MQHFQSILIIIGILAILVVLIHGYLISRKERLSAAQEMAAKEPVFSQADEPCEEGILGDVRIRNADEEDQDNYDFSFSAQQDDVQEINFSTDFSDSISTREEEIEPIYFENEVPETEDVETFNNANTSENNTELKIEDQYFETSTPVVEEPVLPQDFFVFNVAAKEGQAVRGHELLQFFLTAGFRFGDMSIFHRHLNSDGTGPILFSIANMMAPGTFDPEKMEQFRSEGVSFFLTVPNNEINIKKAFDMMLVAVEQMAEEFDCIVLNEKREPLTEAQFRNYHERLLRYI